MKWKKIKSIGLGLMLVGLILGASSLNALPVGAQGAAAGDFTLTILHNNDGESKLLNAGGDIADFGGVARFAALVDKLRAEAVDGSANKGVVVLSSGDNFLAGPEFDASLSKGAPFYDSTAIRLIGYDAMAIGNHEFDFGPDVLADFIEGIGGNLPFVSANLDFTGEPRLQALVDQGTIVKSLVIEQEPPSRVVGRATWAGVLFTLFVEEESQQIGIVGATTPRLSFISSPRNVQVDPDVAGAIQAEIDTLQTRGVNKIILISHLQDINEDLALAEQLTGVDVMIAGGGDELLADEDSLLVPGDEEPFGPYPLIATGADGAQIPVVTTPGDYKYVGRLVVTFNNQGQIIAIHNSSDLVRVAGGDNPDAIAPDPELEAQVVTPVQAHVAELANTVIADAEVALEGRRDPGVRTMETNIGNLIADALLWQANQLVADFGGQPADIALQNGGGIRNNTLISGGPITEFDTFSIAPFSNLVAVAPDIPPDQFKEIMENAVSAVETADGRFAQIAGFKLSYDPAGTPQVLDENGNVTTPGARVREIILDDGTVIVQDGVVVEDAPSVNIATIDFLARNGDQYPFRDASFTVLGVSYQQALSNYITTALGGLISASQYPEGGEGRIIQVTDETMVADQETVTDDQEATTTDQAATADDQAATSTDQATTTDDQEAATTDQETVADDQEATTTDQAATADDQAASTTDQATTTDDQEAATADQETAAGDQAASTTDQATTADDQEARSTDRATTAGDQDTATDQETAAEDQEATTADQVTTDDDEATAADQETVIDDQDATADDEEVTSTDQETTTADQTATADDQEATSTDQATTTDDQETGTTNQETAAEDQEATTDDDEATTADQETAADDQEATVADEEAAADDQETGSADQAASATDQEATADDQETATDDPETTAAGQEAVTTEAETTCTQDYIVQIDDWLSKIAEKFLGDMFAYPAIFEATNAAAAAGGNYATLTDPDVIEVGQILCVPVE
jgi:5'-nucleotidase